MLKKLAGTLRSAFGHLWLLFRTSAPLVIYGHYFLPLLTAAFERCGLLAPGRPVAALEIGSWEGQSGNFILRTLTNARLTCVDTWTGGDEHKDMDALAIIEANFDSNLRPFQDRLTKFNGTSARYFALGVIIFDDYFWRRYRNPSDNPAGAVNAFLRLKKGSYRIVRAYYQLIIQKRESGRERALR
jgi:hypothetical protein